MLGKRQRHTFGPLLRNQRRSRVRRACGVDCRGQFGDGRCVEERPHIHRSAQLGVDPRDHAGGVERVAAECEEVVVDADAVEAEHGLEDRDQCRLGLRARCAVFPRQGREIGRGQRFSVELSAGVQRKLVQDDEHRRHHVLGHAASHRVREAIVVEIGIGTDDVADELLFRLLRRMKQYSRLGHLRLGQQGRFDFAQLDTQTAQLDLEVGAPDVLDEAVAASTHQVAGAVHAVTRLTEGVGHEPIGCQVGASEISASELHARQIELTLDSTGRSPQSFVEHVQIGVVDGSADGNRGLFHLLGSVVRDVDGRFGGTVQVVQFRVRDLVERVDGARWERLTGGEHHPKRIGLRSSGFGDVHREHGGHEVCHAHAPLADDAGEVGGVAVALGLGDHERGTDLQRPEELPHRYVERERSLLQHDVGSTHRVLPLPPGDVGDDGPVAHRDTLRTSRRTGGEDDVGEVVLGQGGEPIRIGDPSFRHIGQVELVDENGGGAVGQLRYVVRGRQDQDRCRDVENVAESVDRMIRVQRHVGSARCGDGVHAHQQIERSADRQSHR